MTFRSVKELSLSLDDDGATWTSFMHKTTLPNITARWFDCSMGAGTPKYNAYVGAQLAATPMQNEGNVGIYLGPEPSAGQTKHLSRLQVQSGAASVFACNFVLCDYLMFYPLIDGDDLDTQFTDNTQTLPRYSSGEGVQCMVVVTSPMSAGGTVTVTYTNSDGVGGRTTTFGVTSQSTIGVLVHQSDTSISGNGASGPFIPLANGDRGIKSIESIRMNAATGGFMAFVLVRPIAPAQIYEIYTATEITQFTQRGSLPEIKSGAYLNFIAITSVGGITPLRGYLEFVWR